MLEIRGMQELIRNLKKVSDDISKDLERCVHKGGEVVKEAAQANIKSHGLEETGALHDNLSINTDHRDSSSVVVKVGPGKGQFYGQFHELGTSKHPKKPFLRPAHDENEERVKEVIAAEIKKIIEGRGRA